MATATKKRADGDVSLDHLFVDADEPMPGDFVDEGNDKTDEYLDIGKCVV